MNIIRQDDDTERVVIVITLAPDGIDILNPNELTDEEMADVFYTLAQVCEDENNLD